MKKEYRAMYDKIAPLKSDEELLSSVLIQSGSRKGNIIMKNENKSRKHITKAIAIPIAAALALGATAVGAVAVYNRNVAEEYANVLQREGDVFKQEYRTSDGEEVNLNVEALNNGLYDELNIELNKTFEYEDFTIEFPGAVCDGRDILIMYNMTFKKDLDCLSIKDQSFGLWGPNDTLDEEGLHGGTRATNGILSEVDGKKVYSGFVDYSGIQYCGESLTLHFEQINSSISRPADGFGWYNVDIDIDLEIPLTADFSKFNKTVVADTAQHVDILGWGEWDVESVDISSLLITFNVKTDELPDPDGNIFKTSSPVFPINVTMKDGSTLELGSDAIYRFNVDQETKEGWFMAVLNYPLDVDNVQSVQFASAVINIDGSATTIDTSEFYEKYDENGHLVER